ncbi:MAG: hypothetical protein QW035_00710 [Candidatus Anstonellales archaeon]
MQKEKKEENRKVVARAIGRSESEERSWKALERFRDEGKENRIKKIRAIGNRPKGNDEEIFILVEGIRNEDLEVRVNSAWALSKVAEEGHDISMAFGYLKKELSSEDNMLKEYAISALSVAAWQGADVSFAKDEIVKLLSHEQPSIRMKALSAVLYNAHEGKDVSYAYKEIAKLLADEYPIIRSTALKAIKKATENCPEEHQEELERLLLDVLYSNAFDSIEPHERANLEEELRKVIESIGSYNEFEARKKEEKGEERTIN